MHPLISLAKEAVEKYIKEEKVISVPFDLPKEFLTKRAGTFVTIEKNGELRGCIGTYLPTRINIAEEVIYNAIAAATEDWRFGPVRIEELPYLSYTVYILTEPKPVKDIKELDPKKYGIIVKTVPLVFSNQKIDISFFKNVISKTGLLLPDLDEVDSVEKQIAIACQKGGIDPKKEKFFIYKFTVEKFQ